MSNNIGRLAQCRLTPCRPNRIIDPLLREWRCGKPRHHQVRKIATQRAATLGNPTVQQVLELFRTGQIGESTSHAGIPTNERMFSGSEYDGLIFASLQGRQADDGEEAVRFGCCGNDPEVRCLIAAEGEQKGFTRDKTQEAKPSAARLSATTTEPSGCSSRTQLERPHPPSCQGRRGCRGY